ncbi:MAG: HAMP domain-containing histidine kinase [Bacteroidia bacterium]|nr:HAMP domain-containing histidine kinase [Bacteroidia bacterium]MCK6612310.1 HAMP domain-containing histidine kinase [Bacteroidia bacterium]
MNLKQSISFNLSIAFTVIFGICSVVLYALFYNFRMEEFKDRLAEKALTTANYMFKVKEIDSYLLKVIDQNSINKLYNEKTLIFDENFKLIYSSIDDQRVDWNFGDLKRLKSEKEFFFQEDDQEIYGVYYDLEPRDYYVIISAEDHYGIRKQEFLLYSLILIYCLGVFLVWFITYSMTNRLLIPLDRLKTGFQSISGHNLNQPLVNPSRHDEIQSLTTSFNQLLERVNKVVNTQKAFTSLASHELRTPISRLTFQLDNLKKMDGVSPAVKSYLAEMEKVVEQMKELIHSLLILSRIKDEPNTIDLFPERLDELLFRVIDDIKPQFKDISFQFEIDETTSESSDLLIPAQAQVLQIAFANLLRNACLYSSDKVVKVVLSETGEHKIELKILNQGEDSGLMAESEIYQPFRRGINSQTISGSGLGLSIVKRILEYHQAELVYSYNAEKKMHEFSCIFNLYSIN